MIPIIKDKFKAIKSKIIKFSDWFDKHYGWIFCPPCKCGKEKRNININME